MDGSGRAGVQARRFAFRSSVSPTTPTMSTTVSTDESTESRECDRDDCAETYHAEFGHAGYCGRTCWGLGTAAELLREIRFDHRFCANCARRLRVVIPPGRAPNSTDKHKDVPECAIGWAIPESHTVSGDAERLTLEETPTGFSFRPADETTQRQVCSCGVTHHATIERSTLSKEEATDHAIRLAAALVARREEGQHDHRVDRVGYLHAVRSMKSDPDQASDDARIFHRALAVGLRMGAEG